MLDPGAGQKRYQTPDIRVDAGKLLSVCYPSSPTTPIAGMKMIARDAKGKNKSLASVGLGVLIETFLLERHSKVVFGQEEVLRWMFWLDSTGPRFKEQCSSLAAEWFGTRLQIAVGVATRNSGGRKGPKNLRAKRTGSWILEQRLDLDLALRNFRRFTAAQVFRSEWDERMLDVNVMVFVDVSPGQQTRRRGADGACTVHALGAPDATLCAESGYCRLKIGMTEACEDHLLRRIVHDTTDTPYALL